MRPGSCFLGLLGPRHIAKEFFNLHEVQCYLSTKPATRHPVSYQTTLWAGLNWVSVVFSSSSGAISSKTISVIGKELLWLCLARSCALLEQCKSAHWICLWLHFSWKHQLAKILSCVGLWTSMCLLQSLADERPKGGNWGTAKCSGFFDGVCGPRMGKTITGSFVHDKY